MSTRNIPNDYNNYFAIPYQPDIDINQEYIDTTKEIKNIKESKTRDLHQMGNPKVAYNPLYSPSDLIDYGIQRNYSNNCDKTSKIKNHEKFDPYLDYLRHNGLYATFGLPI